MYFHFFSLKKKMHYYFSDIEVIEPELCKNTVVYNPYPILGAPEYPCWPRGFPLENILKSSSREKNISSTLKSSTKFGVLQSLADIQPDVDAIYRLTHETPFVFRKGMLLTAGS